MLSMRTLLVLSAATTLAACGSGDQPASAVNASGDVTAIASTPDANLLRAVNSPCEWYGALDGNSDGAIDRLEYGNFGRVQYERWDLDENGSLARAEYDRCVTDGAYRRVASAFEAFDRDGSGSLTSAEFFAESAYSRLDANGSGKLEDSEWQSVA